MYIEKRWLVPGILTVLLFGALLAVAMLLLGQRIPEASGASPTADVAPAEHRAVHLTAARVEPDAAATPPLAVAAALPPRPAEAPIDHVAAAPEHQRPAEHVEIDTEKQSNSRGFGDIGRQFQTVNVNAPITNVHISNQGNNNATNVAVGDQNVVVSKQKDLESNRSDGGGPESTASDGAERTTAHSAGAGATTAAGDDAPPPPGGDGGGGGSRPPRG